MTVLSQRHEEQFRGAVREMIGIPARLETVVCVVEVQPSRDTVSKHHTMRLLAIAGGLATNMLSVLGRRDGGVLHTGIRERSVQLREHHGTTRAVAVVVVDAAKRIYKVSEWQKERNDNNVED